MKFARVLALVLAASCGFAADPAISSAEEARIGRVLATQYEQLRGLAASPQGAKIEAYLQTVGGRVAAQAPGGLAYRFHFDPDPAFKSAVALPGGEIFVGGGLLALVDSEDELATVLAHEVEHVALGQCRSRLTKLLGEQHLSPDSAGDLNVAAFFGNYGHDGELAADREGVKLATAAGYSPQAAVRLLETFVFLAERAPATPKDATTMLEERIAQIRSVIGQDRLPTPDQEKPLALP